jgi:hypothetical protein
MPINLFIPQEALSGSYAMEEDSLLMVEKMINYLYTADYDSDENVDQPDISRLQFHARMFALADKYDIEGLCLLSSEKFLSRFRSSPSALELLESIPDVYTLTPSSVRTLRDKATLCARTNFKKYLRDQSVREAYEKIATEYPEFIKDVLDLYIQAPLFAECETCDDFKPMGLPKYGDVECFSCGTKTSYIVTPPGGKWRSICKRRKQKAPGK